MWKIIEVSPTVEPYQNQISALMDAVRVRVSTVAKPKKMNFILKADPSRTLDIHGFGGFCCDPDLIQLSFNPKNPNMELHFDETLERVIAHEYHHALRSAGPGYGAKLGSALSAEGLAGHFGKQLYQSAPEPWEALTAKELLPWRDEAYENFDSTSHGHANWFFGTGDYPHWLGYSLGYDMIGRYLTNHKDETALSLAGAPSTEFRESLLLNAKKASSKVSAS